MGSHRPGFENHLRETTQERTGLSRLYGFPRIRPGRGGRRAVFRFTVVFALAVAGLALVVAIGAVVTDLIR
jgi:hypothetical protein